MTYSLRTFLVTATTVSLLIAVCVTADRNHKWYNHEVAAFAIDSGIAIHDNQEIRVWTEGYVNEEKRRKLMYQISIDGTPYGEPRVADLDFIGATDDVRIAFAENRRFFCVHSPSNKSLLILGDKNNHRTVGADALTKKPRTDAGFIIDWPAVFEGIVNENPGIDIEYPAQTDMK